MAGKNPTITALLQLNGHDRFSVRDGNYFNWVQPYQHHTNIPAVGINVYSFALQPEQHQPSGTCNLSRIDNTTLLLTVSNNAVGTNLSSTVYVYATNYNVLRIMSGINEVINTLTQIVFNYWFTYVNRLFQTASCLAYSNCMQGQTV
jgi:hypothetical protein